MLGLSLKVEKMPVVGQKRIKNKFLFLPKTINKKTKWLKHVFFIEEFKREELGRILSKVRWVETEWFNGMAGHFWRDKREGGKYRISPLFHGTSKFRTQCVLINNKLTYYDFMGDKKNSYKKYPVFKYLEYLGYGNIYSVNNVIQSPFKDIIFE